MAITDHTERSRPSPATDTQPTPLLSRTRQRMTATEEESHQRRAATLAGITVAHQAVARLLDDTHAYHGAHRKDGSDDSEQVTTLLKTVHGLFTATYFLNQYAETLRCQPAD